LEGSLRLILSRANSLLVQGRYQRLLEWINALPKEVIDDDPWLLYWKGVGLMPFSPAESRDCFEEALNKFRRASGSAGGFPVLGRLSRIHYLADGKFEVGRRVG